MFFTSTKTARVCAFLYVFASGLLSNLLLAFYMGQDAWWCNLVELIPSFALFRGLYIMSQYSFRAGLQNSQGLTFGKFGEPGNGEHPADFFVPWTFPDRLCAASKACPKGGCEGGFLIELGVGATGSSAILQSYAAGMTQRLTGRLLELRQC